MMTSRTPRRRALRAALAAGLLVGAAAAARALPAPARPDFARLLDGGDTLPKRGTAVGTTRTVRPTEAPVPQATAVGVASAPMAAPGVATTVVTTTARTVAPVWADTVRVVPLEQVDEAPALQNAQEVSRALARSYPPLLRDAGIGGTATVDVLVRENGTVGDVRIVGSTRAEFADPARQVAERMRFAPAQKGGRAVSTRVAIPLSFVPAGVTSAGVASDERTRVVAASSIPDEQIRAALRRHHPALLGPGQGDTNIVFIVADRDGNILRTATRVTAAGAGESVSVQRGENGVTVRGRAAIPGPDPIADLDPDDIDQVHVRKFGAGELGPNPLGVVWVTMKQ
jgi:TonB family protein